MERAEWLKQMREKVEELYNHFSPLYWVTFGLVRTKHTGSFSRNSWGKWLRTAPCYPRHAGRVAGMGCCSMRVTASWHRPIRGNAGAGERAFPGNSVQEDGLAGVGFPSGIRWCHLRGRTGECLPGGLARILRNFREALKPDGVLYFTVELPEGEDVEASYQRAKAMGLPVVVGEVADRVDEAYEQLKATGNMPMELADASVYHYHPPLEQVRAWLGQAGWQLSMRVRGSGMSISW